MKKTLSILLLIFAFNSKSFSQTANQDSITVTDQIYVDVGFLLNDLQKPVQIIILKTNPDNPSLKTDPVLLKAIKMKLSEYSQEILSSEWSDSTDSYQMHLIYNSTKKEIE